MIYHVVVIVVGVGWGQLRWWHHSYVVDAFSRSFDELFSQELCKKWAPKWMNVYTHTKLRIHMLILKYIGNLNTTLRCLASVPREFSTNCWCSPISRGKALFGFWLGPQSSPAPSPHVHTYTLSSTQLPTCKTFPYLGPVVNIWQASKIESCRERGKLWQHYWQPLEASLAHSFSSLNRLLSTCVYTWF